MADFVPVLVFGTYSATETLIRLHQGYGAVLPDPATDGPFTLRWWLTSRYTTPTDDPYYEDVYVQAKYGDYLQIVRGTNHTLATDKGLVAGIFEQYAMIQVEVTQVRDDLLLQVSQVKGVGEWNSLANLTARIARLESLSGLEPLPEEVAEPLTVAFPNQWQASFIASCPLAGKTIQFTYPHVSMPRLWVRGVKEDRVVVVGVALEEDGVTFIPAEDGTRIEWATRGTTHVPSEPEHWEGSLAVVTAGTTLNFAEGFSATDDYCIFVSAVSGDSEVVTGITKSLDSALLMPAEDATALYLIIRRTQ